jgi:hypothetical protein
MIPSRARSRIGAGLHDRFAAMRDADLMATRTSQPGGSLVGLSAAIALSRLGTNVTVPERSPSRAAEGGAGLGVDVALLRHVERQASARRML